MKITPKQTPGEAAVKPSVLDKTQNRAIVGTIAKFSAINKVYGRNVPVVKQTLFFIRIMICRLCEASNGCCRLVRSLNSPTTSGFFMSGKEA